MSPLANALESLQALEALAARPSAMAALDPRAKLLATLVFIGTVVSFDRYTVLALLPFALYPVLVCDLGRVPWRTIARPLLVASPLALMVGAFNPVFDSVPVANLWGLQVTGGWVSWLSLVLRFALTVGAALALVATTGLYRVCGALEQLGCPRALTTQLLLLQRYAFVLAGEAARMDLARRLRAGPGRRLPLATYASLLGHLLLRALERAQRIHWAMLSRGFSGSLPAVRVSRWQAADATFLTACLAGCVLARAVDLPRLAGQWIAAVLL
ncbi:MAG: cobalt ECF transporter T component CbiQ [Rhodoferax sp.]|nr:cobalt ECF transporter T component CbiQ [Rhodoferax sp.]MCF8207921.1 cobalt ECF transporter T component CbiQ [Rhodoferax sp.]